MSYDSVDFAASLEATAREIAAAAAMYQRLPAKRHELTAGLISLIERHKLEWTAFICTVAKENDNATEK